MNARSGTAGSSRSRWSRLRRPLAAAGDPHPGDRAGNGASLTTGDDTSWRPFFPDLALREAVVAAALLVVLVVLAVFTRPALQHSADPAATGYVPRPEWYFLWLFQLLKYFKGSLEPVGTVAVPVAVVAAMLALPFVDRRRPRMRRLVPYTRPVRLWPRVVAVVAVALLLTTTMLAHRSSTTSTPAPAQTTAP